MAMAMMYKVLLMSLLATRVLAGGSLTGRVTEVERAQPLAGVNVLLVGTVRGAVTNAQGEFRITNVLPGTYTVVFSLLGYQRVELSNVEIRDGRETHLTITMSEAPLQAEQVVVTASKREQSLQEVPVSTSVLDGNDVQRRLSLTLDEALRYVPGVNLTGPQLNIRGSSGYSLGAGSRVLLLLDGIPFIAGDTGELLFEAIPVGQIDHVEVVKGASSALYGSSALGGVVNVITKPISEIAEAFVRTYGGFYNKPSYAQWRWSDKTRYLNGQSAGLARKFGDFGFSLFLSRQFDDGYRQNDYRRRYNGYLKLRQDLSGSSVLTLHAGIIHSYGGQFLFWRSLDSALVPPLKNQTDKLKSTRFFLGGLFNAALSDHALLTAKATWVHSRWGFKQITDVDFIESLTDGIRAELSARFIPSDAHTITIGLDGSADVIGGKMFAARTIGGAALYAQDEIRFTDNLTLTVGARCDYQSVGLVKASLQLNPKSTLTYMAWERTTLRASFGRGFRVPSVTEAFVAAGGGLVRGVPNTDLKPERSLSYEVGLTHLFGHFGSLDAAVFHSEYDNLIEPGLRIAGQNLEVQWRNVTRARVQGFEWALRFGLFDGGLDWSASYTYVFPQDLSKHDVLKYRPRHLLYTNVSAWLGAVMVGGDFRFVSRVERIDDELVETGIIPDGDQRTDIFVADMRVAIDFAPFGLSFSSTFNVKNVFQRNYVELIGNLMPPRTYVLSLEARM